MIPGFPLRTYVWSPAARAWMTMTTEDYADGRYPAGVAGDTHVVQFVVRGDCIANMLLAAVSVDSQSGHGDFRDILTPEEESEMHDLYSQKKDGRLDDAGARRLKMLEDLESTGLRPPMEGFLELLRSQALPFTTGAASTLAELGIDPRTLSRNGVN